MNKPIFIPIYQPSLKGNESRYVQECLASSWISSRGQFIDRFEQSFADYLSIAHATSVANGTVALHLALLALGIGPGDEVILPTFTYVACANAIRYTGATPVFVDSLKTTWQIDPQAVANQITPRTKAIMAVHLYGHPCDMTTLVKLSKQHQLFLVEDCAESLGAKYQGRLTGTFGDIATFSFYGNKTITTGEGGMVVTPHTDLLKRCQKLKAQGLSGDREYWHDCVAYNYRMTNLCAAIGLAQLERLDEMLKRKQELACLYRKGLSHLPITFHEPIGDVIHAYWMCSILLDHSINRDDIRQQLLANGIETRPLFYPVNTMPMYDRDHPTRFPVATHLGQSGINLPSWPDLNIEQVNFITTTLSEILDF